MQYIYLEIHNSKGCIRYSYISQMMFVFVNQRQLGSGLNGDYFSKTVTPFELCILIAETPIKLFDISNII